MQTPTWFLFLGLVLLPACNDAPPRHNVLVITVDSLRADHLGCYGYERDTSPYLDKLAAESVLFEKAYTHAPFTAPSHASLLTSLYSKTHGVHAWAESLSPAASNLAERLSPRGYRTGAFYNHPGLRTSQITRGFDEVQERCFEEAPLTSAAFLDWVDSDQTQPFGAWVHLWDVHRPYGYRDWRPEHFAKHVDREPSDMTLAYNETMFGEPLAPATLESGRTEGAYNLSSPHRKQLESDRSPEALAAQYEFTQARYDGGVHAADAGLALLVEGLRKRGQLDNTILIITADHGESLTEREPCYFTHDPYLYEETLHVPLLIRFPGGEHAGTRVTEMARLIDIVPTIHQVIDLPLHGDEHGVSLVPVVKGEPQGLTFLLAETKTKNAKEVPGKIERGDPAWLEERVAISDGQFKLILDVNTRAWQLFDLIADPNEVRNLAQDPDQAERFEGLKNALSALRSSIPAAGDTSAEIDMDAQALMEGTGYFGRDKEDK